MSIYRRNKVWYIDYYYNGKRIRKAIKGKKKDAEKALTEIKSNINNHKYGTIKEIKLLTAIKKYLGYSKSNKESYDRDLLSAKHIISTFKDVNIYPSQLTIEDIDQYKEARKKQNAANRTINIELSFLRAVINKMIDYNLASKNIIKAKHFLKEPPRKIVFLSPEKCKYIIDHATPYLKPIIATAVYTGMRRSEILNLKWDDINFNHKIIRVYSSKTNSIRYIPLSGELEKILINLAKTSEYVFTYRGKHIKSINRSFKTYIKNVDPNITFHMFRHAFITNLVLNGANIKTIQSLAGHRDITTTEKYMHLNPRYSRDAIRNLTERIQGRNIVTT